MFLFCKTKRRVHSCDFWADVIARSTRHVGLVLLCDSLDKVKLLDSCVLSCVRLTKHVVERKCKRPGCRFLTMPPLGACSKTS